MSRLFFLFFILVCVVGFSGCTNEVGPKQDEGKDPQAYTWTLDTLSFKFSPNGFEQVVMIDLWGLNDTLVFAGGHDANYGSGSLWKFDGKKWHRVTYNRMNGGPINKSIEFYGVRGFAPNGIYAFGTEWSNFTGDFLPLTAAIHYDGTEWREISMPKGQGIRSVIAVSPSLIYCGGWYDGQLYRYDGMQWSVDTIKANRHPDLYIHVNLIGITNTQEPYLQTEQFKNAYDGFDYKEMVKYWRDHSIILDSAYNNPPWGDAASGKAIREKSIRVVSAEYSFGRKGSGDHRYQRTRYYRYTAPAISIFLPSEEIPFISTTAINGKPFCRTSERGWKSIRGVQKHRCSSSTAMAPKPM